MTTLVKSRTDRRLGGKMFDVCTYGYENNAGINFNNVYDRIAVEIIDDTASREEKEAYLRRDFRWYMFALEDASKDPSDPEFQAKCAAAAAEGWENYKILMEEFVENDNTYYQYGEHEIVVSNNLMLESANEASQLDSNRAVFMASSCENGVVNRKDFGTANQKI